MLPGAGNLAFGTLAVPWLVARRAGARWSGYTCTIAGLVDRGPSAVRAIELAETFPTVGLDDVAMRALLLVSRHGLPGVVVTDEWGRVVAVVPAADVLRFVVPRYIQDAPCLARVCDEAFADQVAKQLASSPVRDVLPDRPRTAPAVRARATAVELAEAMARWRSPLAVIRQGEEILGVVTAACLLDHLVKR
jgi:CBS domain-containing protein